jgi:beta-glucuronidase
MTKPLQGVVLCGLAALALVAGPVHGAMRIDLDRDWQFRADPDEFGEWMGWMSTLPSGTDPVTVPHTWNVGRLHDFMGVGWYFRSFETPAHDPLTHVQLHFGATFYKARIWLNGVEVGTHEGGFTAYAFDITAQLHERNYLAVRIDNRPGIATIPGYGARGTPLSWYDWWTYGGMVRDVWLSQSGPAWVRRQSIRAEQHGAGWIVHDQVFLHSALPAGTPVQVRARAYGPNDQLTASSTQPLTLGGSDEDLTLSLDLAKPRLWGIDHPDMYRMVVDIIGRDGHTLDTHTDTFGVRTVEIRDRHLLINGERVRLTGLARHEDSPAEGLAETPETMRRDYDDLKALNTTLSRPVHYPQNPFILDYADRHGIMLVPEIPVWQFSEAQFADPKVLALAEQQMREMIEEAGNHPSIFAWSVGNESAWGTRAGIEYFRAMRAMIRQLDPQRFVSFADDNLPKLERAEQSAANDADFLLMNQYFGTWHGPAAALDAALDKVNALFPSKMVIISEFGFPGMFAKQLADADPSRIRTIEQQLPMLAARDWIAGAIMWCYQDYKSRRNLSPGLVEGFVEHGVVDEMRRPKPSYAAWKRLTAQARIEAQWTGAPVTGFAVTVTPNSERQLPSYPLHGYQLVWALQDEAGVALAGGSRQLGEFTAPEALQGPLPPGSARRSLRLEVRVLRPAGTVAAERTLAWPAPSVTAAP